MKKEEEEIIFEEYEENTGADSSKKLQKLKDKLKKCEAEKQEYLDSWQRAQADFINLRKQDEKEKQELKKYAEKALIEDLVGVLDSFDMAFSDKEAWEKAPENWRKGIEYIYNQFSGILSDRGLSRIGESGEGFNPDIHEAVSNVEVQDEDKDNTVVKVLQVGYKLHDKVIRHAKVEVGEFAK